MPSSKRRDPLEPRKLPTQGRAAQTVSAILESAAHILETGGFDGYNTNAIAAKAGASIGSVYQYFGSKDAVTMALIAADGERLFAAVDAAAELADPDAALAAMIEAAADHQLRRPRLAQLLDLEERRLVRPGVRGESMPGRVHPKVVKVVEKIYGPHAELPLLCADLVVITRALCDASVERPGDSRAALQERIRSAIHGYLREQFRLRERHPKRQSGGRSNAND
jgi:AcrR family transcriptional regulator